MKSSISKGKLSVAAGMMAMMVALSACSGGPVGAGETVVTVNGTEVHKSDYKKVYDEFSKAFNLATYEKSPQKQMLEDTVKQMTLNKLILNTLMTNDAKQMGLSVTDQEVKDFKQKQLFSNPKATEEFKQYLKQSKLSEAQFDDTLKETLLLNKFLEKKGGKEVQVSDAEVTNFYKANPDQFKQPERIKAKHILVKAMDVEIKKNLRAKNPNISEGELQKALNEQKTKAAAKAADLYKQVKVHPDKFAELARKNSDDTVSAQNGGDLDYMVEANIEPTFWQAIKKTPNGQLHNGVLATPFGYHIIVVEDRQPPHAQTLAEARELIKDHLGQQKKQKVLMSWATEQKKSAKIVINPKYQPQPEQAPQAAGLPAQPATAAH